MLYRTERKKKERRPDRRKVAERKKKMREKFMRFMQGRYGSDQFGRFLAVLTFVLILAMMFLHSSILYGITFLLIVYMYFRIFSRNIQKRYSENQKYLQISSRFTGFFRRQKSYMKQRKTHHIYKCPKCRQKIRIPRGKGKICIRCPKCQEEFIKKS